VTERQRRAVFALFAGIVVGSYVIWLRFPDPDRLSDLRQLLVASAAWAAGRNPYEAVRAWGQWPFPLLYPLPAVLLVTPLVTLPPWAAEAAFMAVSTALLAWGLTRNQLFSPRLILFASAPFLHAVSLNQWSPLLTAAAMTRWAGFLLVCKPNIGVALFAAFPHASTAVGVALILSASTLLWPGWINEWQVALSKAPNAVTILTLPGGVLMLLALFKWRRPEARLLLALSCLPQTTLSYEAVPLFLAVCTWNEAVILWAGTVMALFGHMLSGPFPSQWAWVYAGGLWLLYCAYLPCLVFVLRRPNLPPEPAVIRTAHPDAPCESIAAVPRRIAILGLVRKPYSWRGPGPAEAIVEEHRGRPTVETPVRSRRRRQHSWVELLLAGLFASALTAVVCTEYLGRHIARMTARTAYYTAGGLNERQPLEDRYGPGHFSLAGEEWFIRDFFQDRRGGVFLDVGANHYQQNSNTYFLEKELGWSGVAIDALPEFAEGYQANRPRTRFVALFASDVAGQSVQLFVPPENNQIASVSQQFTKDMGEPGEARNVPTTTLNAVLDQAGVDRLDFMSMDIELAEPKALAGFDVDRFQPELACIEAHSEVRQQILDYFAQHRYVLVGKYLRADSQNLYFTPMR
jgi:FkbM family methyltransferase